MSTDNNDMCANCGKGEEESVALKNCVACKLVQYCSRDCQKAHRSQHKKECKKRATELHDEALFKPPPKNEDCPICFMRMPSMSTGDIYMSCCGKIICSGCIHAGGMAGDDQLCPFCRAPTPSDKEIIERVRKRVEIGDAQAIYILGYYYSEERHGLSQDWDKALELWHRSGELGYIKASYRIANAYYSGIGVERDKKKATHYYELAAMGGDDHARYNLGVFEGNAGNMNTALKHFMIAAGSGYHDSLKMIKQFYLDGYATRDDYAKALKAYQAYLDEVKSDVRDKAAAFSDDNRYY